MRIETIELFKPNYEEMKDADKDHVATPRWVVENIYDIIGIKNFKSIITFILLKKLIVF